jgi:hypothetical protein
VVANSTRIRARFYSFPDAVAPLPNRDAIDSSLYAIHVDVVSGDVYLQINQLDLKWNSKQVGTQPATVIHLKTKALSTKGDPPIQNIL